MSGDRGSNPYEARDNKYDKANRRETQVGNDRTNVPVAAPTIDVTPDGKWAARQELDAPTYIPSRGISRSERSKARRLAEGLAIATGVADEATRLYRAAERLEVSRQDLEITQKRREQIPAKIAHEQLQLEERLGKALMARDAVREQLDVQRITNARLRQLAEDDYELARLQQQAKMREEQLRIAEAETQLAYAAQIGQRRAADELTKFDIEIERKKAEVEDYLARREEARRKRAEPVRAKEDGLPEIVARNFKTESEINETKAAVARQEQLIRQKAIKEDRELTVDELETIDALRNAVVSAEDEIRRGAATDI